MNVPPRPDLPLQPGTGTPAGAAETLPRATWSFLTPIGVYLLGLLVTMTILQVGPTAFWQTDLGFFLATFVLQVAPAAALILWLQVAHKGWPRLMGVAKPRPADVGYGVVGGLATFVGATVFAWVLSVLYAAIAGKPLVTPDQIPSDLSGPLVVLAALTVVVGAPLTEEFFFRGCVFRGFRRHLPLWPAALASALLFALPHYQADGVTPFSRWALVLTMIPVGTAFAWLYERRGSLWTNIAAHATFNIIGLTLILLAS